MINYYTKMYNIGYFNPNSKNYFWVNQMEWLSENDKEKYSDITDENVVPIAKNSGGDIWGIDNTNGYIVLCCHDEEKRIYYADNLKNAVFRAIIEYLSDNSFDTENLDDDDEDTEVFARKYVDECINLFKDDFSAEKISDLKSIAENKIEEYSYGGYTYKSFISVEEADKIIKKYIPNFEQKIQDCNFLDDTRPIRERTPFSEEDYGSISDHCWERAKKYYYKHNELFDAVKKTPNLRAEYYKKALDDIYIPRISTALKNGRKNGTAVDEKVFEDGRKYFINEYDKPVYSETFVSGKLAERTFYFINDNEMYAVNYSISTINGTIKLGDILEARYDHTGKIENVILYNDSQINWYDKYYYKDGKIDKCDEFEWFIYDKPVSYITDKVTDDGIFYGDKNPMLVFTHNYIYEKDIVTEIEIITCNLEQIDITKVKAKSAEYKKLKKDKII